MGILSYDDFLDLLNLLESELRLLVTTANNTPEGLELLGTKLDGLCEFIVCEENERLWKQWGEHEDVQQCAERFRETSAEALCLVEKMKSLCICTGKWDMDQYLSLLSVSVNEERGYAQIAETDKVIFIGAGAFPLSSFIIAKETCAEVLCTDIDDEAIRYGRKLAQFLGLHRNLYYSDSHLKHPEFLETATHVFIASMVAEKQEILEELRSKVQPNCKIIVRFGNGLKSLFNYPLEVSLLKEWRVESIWRDKCIYDTIILQPNKTVAGSTV